MKRGEPDGFKWAMRDWLFAMMVFFMAFAIYIYFNYSHLPLITLAAEFFAFGLSAALIKHYSRHKQKRGGASDVI